LNQQILILIKQFKLNFELLNLKLNFNLNCTLQRINNETRKKLKLYWLSTQDTMSLQSSEIKEYYNKVNRIKRRLQNI
jgi:hypothetical protein